MTTVQGYVGGALAVARRDLLLFMSYRSRLVTHVLTVTFTLTLFYYLSRLISVRAFQSPDDYYAFVVVGLVIIQLLTSTLVSTSGALRQELVAGTFERLVLSPLGAVGGTVSLLLFPFLFSLVLGLLMVLLATVIFGLPLQWSTAPLSLPVSLLAFFAFAPFGILLAAVVLAFKQAAAGAGFVLAGISLVAGLYFPTELLPNWIEWTSEVQPFTPAVDLLRHLLVDAPLRESAWVDGVKLLGFGLVLLPLSVWVLARTLRWSRRHGTVIEY